MKRPSGKKPGRPPLVQLAYLFVFSLLLTGVSFSYYVSTSSGGAGAQVAGGMLTVEDLSWAAPRSLTLGPDPGSASWDFAVANSRGDEVSQVTLQYDVVLKLEKPLPDGVTVWLDGREGQPDTDLWGLWFDSGSSGCTCYTFEEAGWFEAGMGASQTHTVRFETSGAALSEDSSIPFTITVRAEQMD